MTIEPHVFMTPCTELFRKSRNVTTLTPDENTLDPGQKWASTIKHLVS